MKDIVQGYPKKLDSTHLQVYIFRYEFISVIGTLRRLNAKNNLDNNLERNLICKVDKRF
jgi:hypothetical protein